MTFNLVQTVFALNMASNAAAGINDTPQTLQSLFSAYLNGGPLPSPYGVYEPNSDNFTTTAPGFFNSLNPSLLGGDWEVVWGPALYVDLAKNATTGEATNSAFVAKSASNNAYVVAIAGTNFKSLEDWLAEDVNVDPLQRVAWAQFNPAGLKILTTQEKDNPFHAMIDAGSALGVTDLVTKLSDPSQPTGMQSLAGFLQQLPSTQNYLKGSTLYFTGHSLGGALTQVIGLYLYAQLMADGWAKIRTLPTAGPTPGNLGFQMLYDHTFQPGLDPTGFDLVPNWSADVISNADVVPAAWNNLTSAFTSNVDAAGNYASFYGELAPDPIDLKILWLKFEVTQQPFGKVMAELMAAINVFIGTFYWPVFQTPFTPTHGYYARKDGYVTWEPFPLATDADPIPNLEGLAPYVLYAHTSQYNYYFGIGPVPQFPLNPNNASS